MTVLTYEFCLSILLASIRLTSTSCWDGYFSDEDGTCLRCPVHCLICDSNEKCLSCDNGYWGSVCEIPCSKCKTGTSCEKTNEFCLEACRDGLSGILCDARCSENCSSCSRRNINDCMKCASGRYPSKECDNVCSNCNNTACDEDGNCTSGCVNGYRGNNCQSVCSEHCLNRSCDQESGACTHGCDRTYTGNRCVSVEKTTKTEEKTTETLTIFGIVGIVAALIIALVIPLAVCYLRARCTGGEQFKEKDPELMSLPSQHEQTDEDKDVTLVAKETSTNSDINTNLSDTDFSEKVKSSAKGMCEFYLDLKKHSF